MSFGVSGHAVGSAASRVSVAPQHHEGGVRASAPGSENLSSILMHHVGMKPECSQVKVKWSNPWKRLFRIW